VDDPAWVKQLYGVDPVWDGLGVLDFCIVPQVDSPGHPQTEACDRVAEVYRATNTPHRCLRDGDVFIIDGETER
jgi:dipeptidase E